MHAYIAPPSESSIFSTPSKALHVLRDRLLGRVRLIVLFVRRRLKKRKAARDVRFKLDDTNVKVV